MRRRPHLAEVRAAWWARQALRRAHRDLAVGGVRSAAVPAPPKLPAHASRGVEALLRVSRHTCLEGALVRQRWLAAHGVMRDVVIGVTAPADAFAAHAWLDPGTSSEAAGPWLELTRLAP